MHFETWKKIAVVLVCLAGLLISLPNFFSKETVAHWPTWVPHKQLPLGLDLRGGAHLLLAMDTGELTKDWLLTLRNDARKELRDAKIAPQSIGLVENAVQVRLIKPEDNEKAVGALKKLVQPLDGGVLFGGSRADIEVVTAADGAIIVRPTEAGLRQRVSNAVSAAIETVNRRVNNLGVAEATVVRQGSDRILVQFPGLSDTRQLKELIGQTARLTFHAVNPQMSAEQAEATRVPPGYKIYPSDPTSDHPELKFLLEETPVVTGEDLVDAQPGFDHQTNAPVINFRFDQKGARRFGQFTQTHVHDPFAIVLDGKVLSAPEIREPILGGAGQISGHFTVEQAATLANQLRSGALPAKLTVVEERTVGPSLGADSIQAGLISGIVGGVATVVLTVLAYGTFGIFAVIGLAVHGILILALMTLVGTTLTLPGIAGFILTIGMAVDANVLIYERIREELRLGKTAIAAIDAGFTRAFITIADSQLTVLASAAIMFWLGSGPIRGFAVTLTLGILTSIFSAVTVTRLLVALWLEGKGRVRAAEVPI